MKKQKSTCLEVAGETAYGAERTEVKWHHYQSIVTDASFLFNFISSNRSSANWSTRHVHLPTYNTLPVSVTSTEINRETRKSNYHWVSVWWLLRIAWLIFVIHSQHLQKRIYRSNQKCIFYLLRGYTMNANIHSYMALNKVSISSQQKQLTWLRTVHSGDWCLH